MWQVVRLVTCRSEGLTKERGETASERDRAGGDGSRRGRCRVRGWSCGKAFSAHVPCGCVLPANPLCTVFLLFDAADPRTPVKACLEPWRSGQCVSITLTPAAGLEPV